MMVTRSTAVRVLALPALLALTGLHAWSQRGSKSIAANASTATHASAELAKGKLDPATSKPGDQVTLKLTEDVKSNGQVILKKGTPIIGVVRNVKRVEGKSEISGQANSMMEIKWLAPSAQGKASQELMIALQSVSQISPIYESGASDSSADLGGLGGTVGSATPVALDTTSHVNGQSNVALMSMPSVVAADSQTTTALENTFGMSSQSDQLFRVGRGEVIAANGSRQSLDIYSHLNNDTVLTSRSKNFEISSGAQMNLLVGIRKH